MNRPFIEHLHVRDFGCVKDVQIKLTPLHALIGPNDSGKSTVLRALAQYPRQPDSGWREGNSVTVAAAGVAETRSLVSGRWTAVQPQPRVIMRAPERSQTAGLYAAISRVRAVRVDPDAMRASSKLIPHSAPITLGERGQGLPAVYDAFLSRRLQDFIAISKKFVELFPTAHSIQLTNTTEDRKALSIKLVDGTDVEADELSEGMLYWLAFAALPYLEQVPFLVIEEPENGLHPARIREVMATLRQLSETTQIVLATHSPLVINELQPDEVTLLTRPGIGGTVATPLTETRNFAQRAKLYRPGELWLNYADGDLESELVGSDEPAAIAK